MKRTYYDKVHFWGRISMSAEMLLLLAMPLFLSFVKGYHPGWGAITTAFFGVAAMVGHVWFNITDYVTYILVMGPAATYCSAITGDIKNMRLPAAMSAAAVAGESEQVGKRDVLATCGVLVSVVLNLVLSVILVVAGTYLLQIIPPELNNALNAMVPALFGAVFAQLAVSNIKAAAVALPVSIVVYHMSFIPSSFRTLVAILLVVVINVFIQRSRDSEDTEKAEH